MADIRCPVCSKLVLRDVEGKGEFVCDRCQTKVHYALKGFRDIDKRKAFVLT